MSGISTGTGVFSGIDTRSLISQLLAVESRPKIRAQARLQQLQVQQAAYLDFNAKLNALKSASRDMRLKKLFQTNGAASSNADVLTATAGTNAAQGSYSFLVDRLVSTQQMLSRGFTDKDSSALGATSFTFESAKARLDRDVSLSDLNGGAGVARGKIVITDSAGKSTEVDLSKAATVNEVLDAINGNGVAKVTASVEGGKFVLKDTAGGAGTMTVANGVGSQTATNLGIAGSATAGTLNGANVYGLSANTTLKSLNDGNGVAIKSVVGNGPSLRISVGGTFVDVNLGDVYETVDGKQQVKEAAVTTVGGVLKRINDKFAAEGMNTMQARVSADGSRLEVLDTAGGTQIEISETNSTTARDLGLLGSNDDGLLSGKRVLAGLNSTLAGTLNGGKGIEGDGKLRFTTHDGTTFNVDLVALGVRDGSITDIAKAIETASGTLTGGNARVSVRVNDKGTGLLITDNSTGSSNLIIGGPTDSVTAQSLGIATGNTGVATATFSGANLQHRYISESTLVSELHGGKGIGTGKFKITDSLGNSATVDIDKDTTTVAQLLEEINSRGLKIKAEVNANGDGIVIREDTATGTGANKIKIEDETGAVAKNLNIAGTAKAVGAENVINGTYEKTVTFKTTDPLQKVADAINAAGVGVTAAIINDGAGSTPFRLNLTSQSSGRDGRFVVDTGALDLGLSTLDAGENAKVFYGSTDPAKAVLLSSSSNTLDNVITGVKIDLKSADPSPVTLTISRDNDAIMAGVKLFVSAFNELVGRIDTSSKYDTESKRGGPLVGDGFTQTLRQSLFSVVNSSAKGITGRFDRLAEVGIKVGKGGQLELDETRLRAAIAEDPEGVEELFTAYELDDDEFITLDSGAQVRNPNRGKAYKSIGVIGLIENFAEKYLNSVDGVLTNRKKSLDNQIKSQNDRISAFDVRLEAKRAMLERQFAAMETAIGKLQSQSGALQSLG